MNTTQEILLYLSWALLIITLLSLACYGIIIQFRKIRTEIRLAINAINDYTYRALSSPDKVPAPDKVKTSTSTQKAKVYKPSEDHDRIMSGKGMPSFFDKSRKNQT